PVLLLAGGGVALFNLLVRDTSGDTGLPPLLGLTGLLPVVAGVVAVVLLWRPSPPAPAGRWGTRPLSGGPARLEPTTSAAEARRSDQLSYRPLARRARPGCQATRVLAGGRCSGTPAGAPVTVLRQARDGLPVGLHRPGHPRRAVGGPGHHTVAVEEEGAARGRARALVEDTVGTSRRAVRPEVGQQREGYPLLLGPGAQREHRVTGDRDDVRPRDRVRHQLADLAPAHPREREGQEDDELGPFPWPAQADGRAVGVGQVEDRRAVSDRDHARGAAARSSPRRR